jgi:hypothetical protein
LSKQHEKEEGSKGNVYKTRRFKWGNNNTTLKRMIGLS